MEEFWAGLALAAIGGATWAAYNHPDEYWKLAKVLLVICWGGMFGLGAYSMGFVDALKKAEAAGLAAGTVVEPGLTGLSLALGGVVVFLFLLSLLPHLGLVNKRG